MMIQESTKLTGIEPTDHEYSAIEAMYYKFDGDKKAFCKWFVENDGMITALRTIVNDQAAALNKVTDELKEANNAYNKVIAEYGKLSAELEKEQEWQPYELPENVKQADYDKLSACSSRKELTDKEAADMVADEFGFDRSKITIIHSVKQYEKSRNNRLRTVGYIERKALFEAWDWNYIRFNVEGNVTMCYEMSNGDLKLFCD